MSKKWYPVVDVLSCIECGACVNNCPHSVYDKSKTPSPIVINPDSCVEHCHHCGDNCPVGAITYVGNNIGWIAPIFREKAVCLILHRVVDVVAAAEVIADEK